MIKGKTTDGFKYLVDEEVLKDFMFLKYLTFFKVPHCSD